MPKRNCTSPAEWRLQTGKPAEALSPHYRLDCDYGTAVIICWQQGGNEPIYVCGSHAKKVGRSREHGPEARIITPPSEQQEPVGDPIKPADRTEIHQVLVTKSNGSASPDAARNLPQTKVKRPMADARMKSPPRDFSIYGNSAKAMVDEAIWNLAKGDLQSYRAALEQGKSAREAAHAAGGQLAVIHLKISEYTSRLEALFSESTATISLAETIDKPLDQAVLEIISNDAMRDSEKDAAVQELGELQEWMKHGLQGELTPLQADRILLAIGQRLNWGASTDVSEKFKPVYGALYGSLKAAIRGAVPQAQNLHDRLTNLYAAKSDLESC